MNSKELEELKALAERAAAYFVGRKDEDRFHATFTPERVLALLSSYEEMRKGLEFYRCDCSPGFCETGCTDDVSCGATARSLLHGGE